MSLHGRDRFWKNQDYDDKILNVKSCSTPTSNPQLQTICINKDNVEQWAILDSGATSHFLMVNSPAINRRPTASPINVTLPNGEQIQTSDICELDIPTLPTKAREAHIVPGLNSHALVSVVKLCNAGCIVIFTKINCIVMYRGRIVLEGLKCNRTGLWMIPLS